MSEISLSRVPAENTGPEVHSNGDEHKASEDDRLATDVPIPLAPRLESINIYRRGHPLPHDLRARVMLYLQEGMSKQAIANRLSISRSSVLRYHKASLVQSQAVPTVRPRGGYRSALALLDREQVLKLGELLLRQPKLTIRELKQLAVDLAILNPEQVPSDTTVWRAVRKLNLDFSKVVYVDPKGSKAYPLEHNDDHSEQEEKKSEPQAQAPPARISNAQANNIEEGDLIAAERRAFRFIQKQGTDGQLNTANLMFMDETNSRALDQAHYAWGRNNQRKLLFRPKGMSPTFNIIACIGVEADTPGQMFLHYIIVPPRRDFRGVSTKWKPYEFRNPVAGIDFGFSVSQIQRSLELNELVDLMKSQQIKIPQGLNSDEALASELRRILVQVRTHGKVGMLRDMPNRQRYLGGSIKAFRSTAADVVDYIEKLMAPFYVKRKLHGARVQ
jgi:transposase